MISVAKFALNDLIDLRKEDWEGAFILSITGQAAENKVQKLGLYIQDKSELPDKLYRQMDLESKGYIMYKKKPNSEWYIGSIGSYWSTIDGYRNRKALDTPPVSGWQYFDHDYEWHYDSNFKIERLTNVSICLTLKIRKGLLMKIRVTIKKCTNKDIVLIYFDPLPPPPNKDIYFGFLVKIPDTNIKGSLQK